MPFLALKAKFPSIQQVSPVKVGALESAIGLTLLESQAVNAGFPTSAEVVFFTQREEGKSPKESLKVTKATNMQSKMD